MNAKMETMNSAAGKTLGSMEQLTGLERALLVIPLLVGFVLGILALFWGAQLAALTGGTGKDVYLYRLTGAVLLGYVPGLLLTILNGVWTPARIVVIATLVFGLGLLYAVAVALLSSVAEPIVWLIAVTAALTVAITLWLLNQHRDIARPSADIAKWVLYLLVFLTAAAFGTGALFTFAPVQTSQLFGFVGADDFVYRLGGAATLGFAVMGVFELRSRAWREIHLPSINAMVFNGISFVATLLAILAGDPILLLLVVFLVALIATVGSAIALYRQGK